MSEIKLLKSVSVTVLLFLLLFSNSLDGIAQCTGACGPNVVNNSSFELMTTDCDTMNSEIFTDYSQVQDWYGTACITCPGNGSTPDYYNSSCAGAAPTENCGLGTGSVGFFTSIDVGGSSGSNSREYVQTQLSSTLVAGQEYCATIHVKTSPASSVYVPTDGLGLWFTDNMVDIDTDNGGQQFLGPGSIVNATPQIANAAGNIIDTVCTIVTGTFTATGTEDWMVMGNFRPDNAMQTTASCGGFFTFCFGYLIVDQIELVPVCSSCDATITAAGPVCINDPSFNLTATDPGGTWSGNGIVDANNGTFDPSVAGIGSHQIIYDLTCGDADTINLVVSAMDDASFSYPTTTFCTTDTDPTPTVSGLSGGSFSIDNSGVINASTGVIDLSASGVGQFDIVYTTSGSCPNSDTVTIDILNSSDATITPAGPFCANDAAVVLSSATAGGTWSGTGITNTSTGAFDPAVAGSGNHQVIYTILGSCGDADTIMITVNPVDDATFSYAQPSYCVNGVNPVPTIIGLSGGTFSISAAGVINSTTGEINLTASGIGSFTVIYTTNGTCPSSSTQNINIQNTLDASITAVNPLCENDVPVSLNAVDGGGNWSGTGITDAVNGVFDPNVAGAGTHTIIYTISGNCGDADTIDIIVNAADVASISYAASSYCSTDANPIPAISGTTGGQFSVNNGGVIDQNTGQIDLSASGAGSYTVTYFTNGICPDTTTLIVEIQDAITVFIDGAGPFCELTGAYTLTASPSGGIWTGVGITDSINGVFDPMSAGIGTHDVMYTVPGNCGGTDTLSLEVLSTPTISLPPSYAINYGEAALLDPTYSGSGSFNWTPDTDLDCNNCENVLASPTSSTVYCVNLSNGTCGDSACTNVIVDYNCGEVVLPTAFSPGIEGVNSLECVLGNCVVSMHLRIYNRWGELVFESVDQNNCWDGTHQKNGKILNTGVFVYQLDAELIDGTSITQKGNITLLR
ncbi:MAG: gliding motility-associated C-terminal domain-containing protein [Crocinitomicaceae bacterium]